MSDEIQKGRMFKLARDAGDLAWNSSAAMSMGTTAEREVYRKTVENMSDSPEGRLARMIQTVMEADMRGMSTRAVVTEMREEGARLGLVDTDVDTVLGLAADTYATKAATRNPEVFDDGIHGRLVHRTLPVIAELQGHNSMAEAEKSFLRNYADHASAYSNQREAIERLANGENEAHPQAETMVVESTKSPEVDHIQKSLSAMEEAYGKTVNSPGASKMEVFTASKRSGDIEEVRKGLDKPNPDPSTFKKLGNLLGNVLDKAGTKLMEMGSLDTVALKDHVINIVESAKTLGQDISRPVSDFLERAKSEEQTESGRDDSAMRPD
ncbi:hypothetical protein [Acidithiobacillus sulfurivorans]|uniref:Uncharacterized protein n=1 Tax=Acidithiobacillus sulfurivorans TaxID=1958756 RepID=A0ABS6A104_9PROT|nr:hypothetical protein [Acidithiobacillus sulfurivorans]MBU2761052.1 hypothetical protein [Acidithiobacillus sulfurivorans]